MGIGALRDKAGQELGQCAGVRPGKPLLGLAVVEEHPRCELLAAVQERRDRSQRHNSSGQHCLAQQRIDQRALAAFELTKHGQVTALLSQPLQQLVEPGTIGLELRAQCSDPLVGFLQQVRQGGSTGRVADNRGRILVHDGLPLAERGLNFQGAHLACRAYPWSREGIH